MTVTETDGWPALFSSVFKQSRNPMALVEEHRRVVDVNGAFLKLLGFPRDALVGRPMYSIVAGGPLMTPREWADQLNSRRFAGEAGLICADGTVVDVQWGATSAVVDGVRLVLFVALTTSRWGRHFRRRPDRQASRPALSGRELEVVGLVALGSTGPEIADELGVGHETVRTHVRNSMDKLGARSRAHLVALTLGRGDGPG